AAVGDTRGAREDPAVDDDRAVRREVDEAAAGEGTDALHVQRSANADVSSRRGVDVPSEPSREVEGTEHRVPRHVDPNPPAAARGACETAGEDAGVGVLMEIAGGADGQESRLAVVAAFEIHLALERDASHRVDPDFSGGAARHVERRSDRLADRAEPRARSVTLHARGGDGTAEIRRVLSEG